MHEAAKQATNPENVKGWRGFQLGMWCSGIDVRDSALAAPFSSLTATSTEATGSATRTGFPFASAPRSATLPFSWSTPLFKIAASHTTHRSSTPIALRGRQLVRQFEHAR
jgi:hypothetical protein